MNLCVNDLTLKNEILIIDHYFFRLLRKSVKSPKSSAHDIEVALTALIGNYSNYITIEVILLYSIRCFKIFS